MNLAMVNNPETALVYPKVLISKGPLPSVDYATALVNEDGNILFSWTDNTGTGTAETWIGFLSADEKNAANSAYAGSILL